MKKLFFTCLLAVCGVVVQAQVASDDRPAAVDIGFGFGLDYGGFGLSMNFLPDPHLNLFGSVGYAIAGAGYNFGAKVRFNPKNKFCFTASGMYGYNAAIRVTDTNSGTAVYKKLYYGPSFGIGGDLRARNPRNYWAFELIIPVRSSAVKDDINGLRASGVSISDPTPVLISVGYHVGI